MRVWPETRSSARNSPRSARSLKASRGKRAVSDQGRELARAAVAKHRIHHEAAARADRGRRMKCLVCEDCGWLCENHRDRPSKAELGKDFND
jgi:hypothetical protein